MRSRTTSITARPISQIGCAGGPGQLRLCEHCNAGPLRLRSASAVVGDFAVCEAELHRSPHDRSVRSDALVGPGNCGSASTATQGRCGYGPRLPLLVISPYAKQNYIDHRTTDQSDRMRWWARATAALRALQRRAAAATVRVCRCW